MTDTATGLLEPEPPEGHKVRDTAKGLAEPDFDWKGAPNPRTGVELSALETLKRRRSDIEHLINWELDELAHLIERKEHCEAGVAELTDLLDSLSVAIAILEGECVSE